jgi:xylulokinase
MVPSLTAVDAVGKSMTPGLLYGDSRGRVAGGAQALPMAGEAAEFLRWTAREAPDAAGYWPAPAVANHALAGEAVIDMATASTSSPLFDGSGWNAQACAECGVTVEQMPRVEIMGAAAGQICGTDAVLAAGAIDAFCEQLVDDPAPGLWEESDRRGEQRRRLVP